jgi:aminoglycoside phosphotransferase (APT) family kinase protein
MGSRGLSPAALDRVRDIVAPAGRVVRVRPMRGGISSSVHLVHLELPDSRREAVVVRRYGEYWQRTDPAACEREFKLLEVLSRRGMPVPKPLLLDADGGPFGAPTVVMSRLPGRPLLDPRDLSDYVDQMAQALARLHALPTDELAFLPDQRVHVDRSLSVYGGPAHDSLQRSVYEAASTAWPRVAARSSRRVLVHGDYWPGNMLWRRGRLVGVIDWEQPRMGDPVSDVATCRGDLSTLFGPDAADQFVERYQIASGVKVENLRFWNLLISTWAVREMHQWATAYPVLGRPDVTPALAEERIRAFARSALETAHD